MSSGAGEGGGVASAGWELHRAELEIASVYGDTVSVAAKNKSLHIFGHRINSTTAEVGVFDIQATDGVLATETQETTNSITSIVSNNTGDTMDIRIEGHTISGNDLTFVVQTATLTGTTPVTLSTALARCSLLKVSSGTTANAGLISIYEGGAATAGLPDVGAGVHNQMRVGVNKSEKGATSISSVDYLIITEIIISCHDTTSIESAVKLDLKATDGVWFERFEYAVSVAGTNTMGFEPHPYIIIPKNHDVKFVTSTASGTMDVVTANINGFLASVL